MNPKTDFGREISVALRIPSTENIHLVTRGYLMRESTTVAQRMGIKFCLEPDIQTKLSQLIQVSGFYPTDYLRKYPRIPTDTRIQTFPVHVLASLEGQPAATPPIVLSISNLSPNGLLLYTENQQALTLNPGQKIRLTIEPRGWFPMPVQLQGLICRIVDELEPKNGNIIRYLGIKFLSVDDINRTAFLDLLKDILGQIKKAPPV
ncbi:PilZ domain-containing protein [Bdellovibrionota bacterium FG-1]